MQGRTLLLFNDSTAAEALLIRGYSNKAADMNGLVSEFWRHCAAYDVTAYVDRVPTDCNPSDGASRGKALEEALLHNWELCQPEVYEAWRKHGPGHGTETETGQSGADTW